MPIKQILVPVDFSEVSMQALDYAVELSKGFDAAVAAGREAGAYGVTISGAGSALLGIGPMGAATHIAGAIADALTRAGNRAMPLTPGMAEQGLTVGR